MGVAKFIRTNPLPVNASSYLTQNYDIKLKWNLSIRTPHGMIRETSPLIRTLHMAPALYKAELYTPEMLKFSLIRTLHMAPAVYKSRTIHPRNEDTFLNQDTMHGWAPSFMKKCTFVKWKQNYT